MRNLAIGVVVGVMLLAFGALTAAQGLIEYGTAVSGSVTADTPSVTYNFSGTAGDFVNIQVVAISPLLDPTVTLLAPSGQPLGTNDNGLSGFSSLDAELSIRLTENGTYTLVVGRRDTGSPNGEFFVRLSGMQTINMVLPPGQSSTVDVSLAETTIAYNITGQTVRVEALIPDFDAIAELFDPATGVSLARFNTRYLQSASVSLPDASATYQLIVYTLDLNAAGQVIISLDNATERVPVPNTAVTPVDPNLAGSPMPDAQTTGMCMLLAQASGLNIRTGPGQEYSILVTLSSNDNTATIMGQSGGWYQVRLADGRIGWASANVSRQTGDCSNLPVAIPPAA